MRTTKQLWSKHLGLIDLNRLRQTSPNVLIFALFNRRKNSASIVRYYFARLFWKQLPAYGAKNAFRIIVYFFIWPYYYYRYTKKVMGIKPYKKVRQLTGKSIFKQILEQFYLTFFYSLSAKEYFMYEIYKTENRRNIQKYMLRLTFKPLIYSFMDEVYMKRNGLTEMNHQDSKSYFNEVCSKYNLPTISVLAKENAKDFDLFTSKEEILTKGDLFIKPEEAKGGRGGEIWKNNNNIFVNSAGVHLDFESLLKHIKELQVNSLKSTFIIQPRIYNHKEINFQTRALSTVRINTLLIDGQVHIPFAVFRFSTNTHSDIDNFHAGGYASPINISNGELGSASNMGFQSPGHWIDSHPVNEALIKGLVLPFWEETKSLVTKAHQLGFYNRTLLGWDVAITDEGPLLVECNGWPDNELIQKPYDKPYGDFPEFMLLANKIEKDYNEMYAKL